MSPDRPSAKLPPDSIRSSSSAAGSTAGSNESVGSKNQFLSVGTLLLAEIPAIEGPRSSKVLPKDFQPDKWSVICGRGKKPQMHIGNRRLQVLVECHARRYEHTRNKLVKSAVVSEIVEAIRNGTKTGGFVKRDQKTELWYEVGDEAAREKVSSALRFYIARKNSREYKTNNQRRKSDPMSQRNKSLSLSHSAKAEAPAPELQISAPQTAAIATTRAATKPTSDARLSTELEPDDILPSKGAPKDFFEYCFGSSNSV